MHASATMTSPGATMTVQAIIFVSLPTFSAVVVICIAHKKQPMQQH